MKEIVLCPMPRTLQLLKGEFSVGAIRSVGMQAGSAAKSEHEAIGRIVNRAIADATSLLRPNIDHSTQFWIEFDKEKVPHADGYILEFIQGLEGDGVVKVTAATDSGLHYALRTLTQLLRQFPDRRVPCLRIEDWPDFPNRGVMLDISRDKVPTMETLYALVDKFTELKINQLQLYTEHTFAYRNHETVWREASPMTAEETRALDAYCRERFIELVPNQNSFGHMERWLMHSQYLPLAEAPDGFIDPWGTRRAAFGICPGDPNSLKLLEELYDEMLQNFSSKQFNVGCDETFDLGAGRSKEECEKRGVGRVYLDFLLKIHALCKKHGKTMQFWGDIIMHHPELIPELPKDVIALEWGYEANHPFAADGEKFKNAGIPYYVCPGTSSWNTIGGRTGNAMANLRNAAESGLANGAIGFLNTDWGDNGHWQPLSVSFLGFAYGAAVSWCAATNGDINIARALDVHVFEDDSEILGRTAVHLGNAYQACGALVSNSSALSLILFKFEEPVNAGKLASLNVEGLEKTFEHIDNAISRLSKSEPKRADGTLIKLEFKNAAALMRHACQLGIARLKCSGKTVGELPPETRAELAAELEPIIAEYRELWLKRNRVGGLKDSAGRLEKLLAVYR